MSTCRECVRAGGTTTVTDTAGRHVRITWSGTYGRHDVSWWDEDGAGARRRRRRRAVRHDDAVAAARRALAELNGEGAEAALRAAGVLKDDTDVPVRVLAEQWVAEVLRRDRARSEAYVRRCESQVRVWVSRLGTVGEWTEDATVQLLAQTGTVSSRHQLLSLLRQVSRWAWREGYIDVDIVRNVELDPRRNGQRNRSRHGVQTADGTAEEFYGSLVEDGHVIITRAVVRQDDGEPLGVDVVETVGHIDVDIEEDDDGFDLSGLRAKQENDALLMLRDAGWEAVRWVEDGGDVFATWEVAQRGEDAILRNAISLARH